ncbi:hypothetical protein GCM10009623_06960 [Nocardioides aestuarii]|uniref:DUF2510 domain-containing protein n=1 Tax=Nocardioides aestuarii TaxID=252231 RepID=A0ABW4TFG2_9ACTN
MTSPPAGWYPDPQGLGQRFWDGTGWTDQVRPGGSRPPEEPVLREPVVAWSLTAGAITYVALLVLLGPLLEGGGAYLAGRLSVPAAVGVGVMVLVGRTSSRPLGWWVYALGVPASAFALAVAISSSELVEAARVSAGTDGSSSSSLPELTLPTDGGGWTVLDSRRARTQARRITDAMEAEFAGRGVGPIVGSFYAHADAATTSVLFVGVNGDIDPGISPEQNLTNFLAGAKVEEPERFDPGDVGGVLGCGEGSGQGLEWVSCAWATDSRIVALRWDDRSVTVDAAAELTRDLRDRALAGRTSG